MQRQIDDVFYLIVGEEGTQDNEGDIEVQRLTRAFMRDNGYEQLKVTQKQ